MPKIQISKLKKCARKTVSVGPVILFTMLSFSMRLNSSSVNSANKEVSIYTSQDLGIRYSNRTKVFESVTDQDREGYTYKIGPGFKFGEITKGEYQGYSLISAEAYVEEPCKGEGCDRPTFMRFLMKDKELIYLSRNSQIYLGPEEIVAKFEENGFQMKRNNDFAIDLFIPVNDFHYQDSLFELIAVQASPFEIKGQPVVFIHPIYGNVYFRAGEYFFILPDGVQLGFQYFPPILGDNIIWKTPPEFKNVRGFTSGGSGQFDSRTIATRAHLPRNRLIKRKI